MVSANLSDPDVGLRVRLVADDGTLVGVEPAGPALVVPVFCRDVYRFFRPTVTLDPKTTYTVRVETVDEALATELVVHEATFSTGETIAELAPAAPPTLAYNRLLHASGCEETDVLDCRDYADLSVSGTAVGSAVPSWLLVGGVGVGPLGTTLFQLGGMGAVSETSLIPLLPDEPCLDYTWIATTGATLRKTTLCEPATCARFGPTSMASRGLCGGLYFESTDIWSELDASSCDDPPLLGDGGVVHENHEASAGLCSFQVTRPNTPLAWPAWLGLLAATILRRRP